MPAVRILVAESERFSPEAAELLRGAGRLELAELDRAGLLAALAEVEVLWVRLRHRVDEEVLSAAPRLRAVVSPTTGLNHVDLRAAEARGVSVLSLRGETDFLKEVRATAEHTVGLMLALMRHIPAAVEDVRAGAWARDRFVGSELHERAVGVVGYGRLGRIVARYLACFGARVTVTDPHLDRAELEPGVGAASLPELLEGSRLVTLHADLNEDNHGFFGRAEFARMPPGALFVNTARGELVDERALLEALRSGRLAGAALDVLAGESAAGMGGHPLVDYAREHGNLLITPHVGGATAESMERTERFMAGRLLEFLSRAQDTPGPAA